MNNLVAERKYSPKLLALIIVLLTLAVYFNSLNNQFLNDWDDGTYITYNKDIQPTSDQSLVKNAFTKFSNGHYHPLTTISYGIEYKLFGLEAKPYHVFNLLFHIICALLVFLFIKLLANDVLIALTTAILFAVHPMHVESVAWISDRKDLLCTLFYVGSLCTYLLYLKKGGNRFYAFTFLLFIAALLSKAMAITLPFVLLIIDYFKDRKFSGKVIIEKIPFLILSVMFGYISILSQKSNDALGDIAALSIVDRLAFSGYSIMMYLVKLVWFADLSAFYNYPLLENGKYPMIYYILPLVLLVLGGIVFKMKKKRKLIIFSFGFFLITIALVLQIIPAGNVIMADRYTYLPYIGLFFLIAVLAKQVIDSNKKYATIINAVLFIYVIACCYFSFERTKVWHDSMALWTDTIEKNPDAALPYNNRANLFLASNQPDKALSDLNKAVEIRPKYVSARYNRGTIFLRMGKFDEAIADLTFVSENPNRDPVSVFMNRGDAYVRIENYPKAIEDFSSVIKIDPRLTQAYYNRGLALYTIEQYVPAINDFTQAIKMNSNFTQAYYLRGLSLYKSGNVQQAYADIGVAAKMGYKVNPNLVNEITSKLKDQNPK